jgi:putative transposase
MADTYSQIYLQFVFSVKNRQSLIPKEHKEELHKYITGLVQNRKAKMLAVSIACQTMHTFLLGLNLHIQVQNSLNKLRLRAMNSLMQNNGQSINLNGKKDSEFFHTRTRTLTRWSNTL